MPVDIYLYFFPLFLSFSFPNVVYSVNFYSSFQSFLCFDVFDMVRVLKEHVYLQYFFLFFFLK